MNHNISRQIVSRALTPALRRLGVIGLIGFTCILAGQDLCAQIDDGGFDFGDQGGDIGNGGGGGIGGDGGNFGDGFGDVLGDAETTDNRNQGFVGQTATGITDAGFVGPPGELSGTPLSQDAQFGGGVNNVGGGNNGGGGGGNRNNTGFGGANGQGELKGFQVNRSSVRAILRPRFEAPRITGNQSVSRFQNRIIRQPTMLGDGANVQISINNRTAVMQGFVRSNEEADRIKRQLSLEPGVYRIENRLEVIGQQFETVLPQ